MKPVYPVFLISLLLSSSGFADGLKPFTSDGCSVFPDGTFDEHTLWMNCCIQHDLAYWRGGTFEEKQRADEVLYQCVVDTGRTDIAKIMFTGVQLGGSAYFPTGYRWGYGWSYLRGYQALNDSEKAQVKFRLNELRQFLNDVSQ